MPGLNKRGPLCRADLLLDPCSYLYCIEFLKIRDAQLNRLARNSIPALAFIPNELTCLVFVCFVKIMPDPPIETQVLIICLAQLPLEICNILKCLRLNCTCSFEPMKVMTRKSLLAVDTLNSLYTRLKSLSENGMEFTHEASQTVMVYECETAGLGQEHVGDGGDHGLV